MGAQLMGAPLMETPFPYRFSRAVYVHVPGGDIGR